MLKKNSSLRKVLSILLALSVLIGMMPNIFASVSAAQEKLGSVESLIAGGEVNGSTVTFNSLELDWTAKDETIGRNEDGWWVGIKVLAPEGMTEEELKLSKYISNTEKSFWLNKDSKDGANRHYIELWGIINENYINSAKEKGKEYLEYKYQFDWNADGTYEQPVTIKVKVNGVVLNKVEQQNFGFTEPNPIDKWVGETYTNPAVGGQGTGEVTYSIVSGSENATINPSTGELSFKNIGSVKVKATKAADSTYKEAVAYYTVKAIKYPQGVFKFNNSQSVITMEFKDKEFTNVATGGSGEGKITYSIVTGTTVATIDAETGKVTFLKAGDVIVVATKAADDQYEATTATYTLKITESKANALVMDSSVPTSITFNKGRQNIFKVDYNEEAGNLFYEVVSGSEYVTVHPYNGGVTTKKAGGSFTVKVSQKVINGYEAPEPIRFTVYIEHAEQSELRFGKKAPVGEAGIKVTYNDNDNLFTNVATGGTGTGAITYSIESGSEFAEVNPQTGEVKLLAAGTVTVLAVKAGDDQYKAKEARYALIIEKDMPEFDVEDVNLIYGGPDHYISVDTKLAGDGKYSYSIVGENKIGAVVNENGRVTFVDSEEKVGSVTIKVKKAEDSQYKELEKEFTLTVSYLETTEKPSVSGDKKNDSGWYTDNITLFAPEGYLICDNNNISAAWSTELILVNEDKVGNKNIYLKNQDGITDAIPMSGLLIDKTNPTDLSITYTTPLWERFLEAITFGFYNSTEVVVTLTAKDEISGIDYFTYNYTDDKETGKVYASEMSAGEDGTVTYSFKIATDYKDNLSFSVVDKAGRESTLEDDKIIVVDFTKPEIEVSYDYKGYSREENGIIYTNDSVVVKFKLKESNFDLSLLKDEDKPKINLDGEIISVTWTQDAQDSKIWYAECNVASVGDHRIAFEYTDLAKNEPAVYEKEIRIDDTAPIISVEYLGTAIKDNIFNGSRVATITVTEHNFFASDMEINVTAKDITGADVDISSKAYSDYVKNPANWTTNGDKHTIKVVFDIDAIYTVDVDYNDLANYSANEYDKDNFVIDKTPATGIKVEYSSSIIEKVLETATFGFFKADVIVDIVAEDVVSGVDYFEINYTPVDGKNNSNKETLKVAGIKAVQDTKDAKMFTGKATLKADFRGKITVEAVDNATNAADTTGDKIIIADTIAPGLEYKFEFENSQVKEFNNIYYTQGQTKVEFTITEANFDLSLETEEGMTVAAAPVITVNGVEQETTWTQIVGTDKWVGSITISDNGDYDVAISYADRSINEMETYTKKVHIDNVAPVFEVSYHNNNANNTNNYKASRVATVKITEHNFNAENVKFVVTATDIYGNPIDISSKGYSEYAKNPANWISKGDVHTLRTAGMKFDIDAVYHVEIDCTDLAENKADTYVADFVIDKTIAENIKIEYKTPFIEKILETATFRFFKADVVVEVTAEDDISGVDFFEIIYKAENGKNNSNKADFTSECIPAIQDKDNAKVFTATYTLESDFRGAISVKVTDKAGNAVTSKDNQINIADTVAPGLDCEFVFKNGQVREYNNIYYTKDKAEVVFTVSEANFDLSLKKSQDENKAAAPVVTVNGVEKSVSWTQVKGTDDWVGKVTLNGNGDYVVAISYADRSTNEMETFTKEIHIDNVAPIFDVTYDNNDVKNTNNYKADRIATVKITEHNFKVDEVKLVVTAKDIYGNPIDISSKAYAEYVKNPENWTSEGDVHTLDTAGMKFDIDAIYHVELDYTDLAENDADTYVADFVIDKTIANNIKIEYKTSFIEKILETATFRFFKADVVVELTADDITSGVYYFEVIYEAEDGKNNSNKASFKSENVTAVQSAEDAKTFTAVHTLKADFRGKISVNVADKAGNQSKMVDNKINVADTIVPGLDYKFEFVNNQVREYNNIYYTQGQTRVEFTMTEANFDLTLEKENGVEETVAPVIKVNGVKQEKDWTQVEGTDKWVSDITLIGNGDYVVELTYADRSTNEMETFTKEIHIDNVAPVFNVTYDNNSARNANNYKADRTATIKITEHNFKAEEVSLSVTAEDIQGNPVDISSKKYAEYAKNPDNWTTEGDVHTLNTDGMRFDIDAVYHIELDYTDLAENEADTYVADFIIDKTKPENIKIEYSESVLNKVIEMVTFGFYKTEVVVTVTAEDNTAGVEYLKLTYTKQDDVSTVNTETYTTEQLEPVQNETRKNIFTTTYKIPANARGTVSVEVLDKAGNLADESNKTVLVVDAINPTREVLYAPYKVLNAETMLEVDNYAEGDNAILYYQDKAVVTFKITEANFDLSLKDDATKPVIKVNDKQVNVDWIKSEGDVWTATYTITGDGDYVVTMTYTDLSSNEMVEYKSCKIAIDGTAPVIDVKYDNGTPHQTLNDVKYYPTTQTVNITITEHNFRADDVELTITAKDIQGKAVNIASKQYSEYAMKRENWTSVGDVHTLNTAGMKLDTDAVYTFDIVYDDICDNYAADYPQDDFVVDHNAPTDIRIEYSNSIAEKIIKSVTFGFYQPDVTVTLIADDITSGVDFFDWTYTKEAGTSDKNAEDTGAKISTKDIVYSNNGMTATATFTIPANARGHISATATDRTGNVDSKTDNNHINIVDNIAPTISVEYVADDTATLVQFVDDNKVTVDSFEKATTVFYNGNVTANIVINEANFFEGQEAKDGVIHQVGIKLTKTDDNGVETVIEYLPAGATQKYAKAKTEYITWKTTGDEHTISINYQDSADYVLEIEYTDHSLNDADITANDGNVATKTYKSKAVTVDKIAPVISVDYKNENVIYNIDERDYYDAKQTAVITVEEHNFRADDFVATVTAKDVLGTDINVEDFKATLSDDSKWTKNGNVYTNTIVYSVDANYTFDYEYKDLAQNVAADYETDLFAVDTTAPENLTVSYSTSILDKILESVTFGYYNAEMTVTISAEDDVAGVYYFVYSYVKSDGVSDVNTELINDKIEDANNKIVHEGKKSTTSFVIPKLLLKNDNQFNGTVNFVAYDRADNNTQMDDNRRVVVDNIAPTATITYSEPVQNANDISYYNGNIDATIVINEANFYSEDVVIKVTRDGVAYPVNVKWVDDSADIHTGTFTLTEDGDYIVVVEYKDRSDNVMTTYASNRLTIDTKAPTVNVTNIKNNSANKDEKYTFTITANDINLDPSTFKPVLKATVRTEDGSYAVRTVSLGDIRTVEAGKSYAFTVNNLTEDAVYALSCTLKDMSGNEYSKIALSDGKEYDEVRFSINRNGSTFIVDEDTDKLVNQYYTYSVNKDIVISEINVDPVEVYAVMVNGKVLTEGTDYTTTMSNRAGEWCKRTYVISKDLFKAEGEYNIVVESTDKTETTSYSDVKNLNVSFVVDQTAPTLTISGFVDGGFYQIEEQVATIIPTDDGGRLNSIKVVILDSKGAPIKDANDKDISVRFEKSGEELLKYLDENGGKITFIIPNVVEAQIQIICNDCAIDDNGKSNEYNMVFKDITVSPSGIVIFYANKPLFYGSIAGISLLVVGIALIIIMKKRKENA